MTAPLLDRSPADPYAPDRSPSGTPPLSPRELDDLVRGYALDTARWSAVVRFERDRRWWTRLRGDDQVDVWLLTWLEDQATELHDHGDSAAAMAVVQGRLHEVRPAADGGLRSVSLRPGGVRRVPVGTAHDVRNTDPEPAVSIHAYSPPLTRMTYYAPDAAGRQRPVRTVPGDQPEAVR